MRLDEWFDREMMDKRLFLSYWINANRDDPTRFPLSMEESKWQAEFDKWQKDQQTYDEE